VSLEAVLPVLVVVAGQAFNLLVDRPD
jgi:hypothetical protein